MYRSLVQCDINFGQTKEEEHICVGTPASARPEELQPDMGDAPQTQGGYGHAGFQI